MLNPRELRYLERSRMPSGYRRSSPMRENWVKPSWKKFFWIRRELFMPNTCSFPEKNTS